MKSLAIRLLRDDRGQDLVEYALLASLIGFAGLFVVASILDAIRTTYGSHVTAVNNLWESPAPSGGS